MIRERFEIEIILSGVKKKVKNCTSKNTVTKNRSEFCDLMKSREQDNIESKTNNGRKMLLSVFVPKQSFKESPIRTDSKRRRNSQTTLLTLDSLKTTDRSRENRRITAGAITSDTLSLTIKKSECINQDRK